MGGGPVLSESGSQGRRVGHEWVTDRHDPPSQVVENVTFSEQEWVKWVMLVTLNVRDGDVHAHDHACDHVGARPGLAETDPPDPPDPLSKDQPHQHPRTYARRTWG